MINGEKRSPSPVLSDAKLRIFVRRKRRYERICNGDLTLDIQLRKQSYPHRIVCEQNRVPQQKTALTHAPRIRRELANATFIVESASAHFVGEEVKDTFHLRTMASPIHLFDGYMLQTKTYRLSPDSRQTRAEHQRRRSFPISDRC
jgi:hypothetical protein